MLNDTACSVLRLGIRISLAVVMAAGVGAKAPTSHVLVGMVRPPINPDQVKVYLNHPDGCDEIAVLDASSKSTESLIERMKVQAARLGANGIVLEAFDDSQVRVFGSSRAIFVPLG